MKYKRILLFRFHDAADVACGRIRLLRHYNPELPIHVLYGGELSEADDAKGQLDGIVDSFWSYTPSKDKEWKWRHSDLMTKAWYREFGHTLDFDHLYSYEYDLLTLAPLIEIYPEVDSSEIALAAAEEFTEYIENRWNWTGKEPTRSRYLKFCEYLKSQYGIARQKTVCLGPGPLLSRSFLDKFAETDDVDLVHEEIALPAYAEAFGITVKDNGMHPGFFKYSEADKYFTCMKNTQISIEAIRECIIGGNPRRAFHPVKYMVKLEDFQN